MCMGWQAHLLLAPGLCREHVTCLFVVTDVYRRRNLCPRTYATQRRVPRPCIGVLVWGSGQAQTGDHGYLVVWKSGFPWQPRALSSAHLHQVHHHLSARRHIVWKAHSYYDKIQLVMWQELWFIGYFYLLKILGVNFKIWLPLNCHPTSHVCLWTIWNISVVHLKVQYVVDGQLFSS